MLLLLVVLFFDVVLFVRQAEAIDGHCIDIFVQDQVLQVHGVLEVGNRGDGWLAVVGVVIVIGMAVQQLRGRRSKYGALP